VDTRFGRLATCPEQLHFGWYAAEAVCQQVEGVELITKFLAPFEQMQYERSSHDFTHQINSQ
jgi:hypothetical protein